MTDLELVERIAEETVEIEDSEDLSLSLTDFEDLFVAPSDWTISSLAHLMEKQIDLDPESQRRNVWSKAAKSRFRPILMTAFSFILGVFPLVIATGTGAEARKVMGMALLGGMSIATILGVFFYPMLFILIGKLAKYEEKRDKLKLEESTIKTEE